ncbi:Predicted helicase [Plasmopara halstedii]|uniref:Predicted helicase n=1 Tax=Plasmopara halstedii TaxID=4781 RepID=A0A0P1A983_PLAHL|nr:Predicted helicase [Plasmopara halstedii]CEG37316.1 Predicted helicase [Plasmopara halstedii]|eukprot:XP_024573685.1 Predicted helicase [Plasmopara halstedii]
MALELDGGNNRAIIPTLLPAAEQERIRQQNKPQYRQRWGWRDGESLTPLNDEVVNFVRTYAWPKETEMALQALFDADFKVTKAIENVHSARREKLIASHEMAKQIQKDTFERVMAQHGKKFHLVKRRFPNVTVKELVSKFYQWKKTPEYEMWHNRQREKGRKRTGARFTRLPRTEQDVEYCTICLKEGTLLCCNGCERAYHFTCVQPAVSDVPEGDWFCPYCQKAPIVNASWGRLDEPARPMSTKLKGSSLEIESDGEKRTATCGGNTTSVSSHRSQQNVILYDVISDNIKESKSDGSVSKVGRSFLSSMNISRKRKQHYGTIKVGQTRTTSPFKSLEVLSSSPRENVESVHQRIGSFIVETVSSSRSKKRLREFQHGNPQSISLGV